MNVFAIKTHKVTEEDDNLLDILEKYLTDIQEKCILVITSKIVSITEGRVVPIGSAKKQDLVEKESSLFLPSEENKYNFSLTITNGFLTPAAGIDESNAHGNYVLWPKNPQYSANRIREYIQKRYRRKHVGVIITDSRTVPLKWGTIGTCLAHSGFLALNDYRMTPDIFGKEMKVTQANIAEALAVSAVAIMGEGAEQTPLALITDVPFVHFQTRNPTIKELDGLKLGPDEDLYGPLLTSVQWKKGRKK